MSTAPCETFGLWHHFHTVQVVADRRRARDHHALRVMRCERCGTLAYRWAPLPDPSDPTGRAHDPTVETSGDGSRIASR